MRVLVCVPFSVKPSYHRYSLDVCLCCLIVAMADDDVDTETNTDTDIEPAADEYQEPAEELARRSHVLDMGTYVRVCVCVCVSYVDLYGLSRILFFPYQLCGSVH